MRDITFNDSPVNESKVSGSECKNPTARGAAIAFAGGGGLFFLPLGLILFGVFTVSGGGNASLNDAGVASVIAAFVFFGLAAHLMDKSDADKRRQRRQRIEEFNRK